MTEVFLQVMKTFQINFSEKARILESLGAKGGIVMDNVAGSSSSESPLFAMSGDGTDDISIPMLFLFDVESRALAQALADEQALEITMHESTGREIEHGKLLDRAQNLQKKQRNQNHFNFKR